MYSPGVQAGSVTARVYRKVQVQPRDSYGYCPGIQEGFRHRPGVQASTGTAQVQAGSGTAQVYRQVHGTALLYRQVRVPTTLPDKREKNCKN